LTPEEVKGFRAVESHLDEDFLGENPLPLTAAKAQPVLEKLRKDFAAVRVSCDDDGRITGRPIHFTINPRIYKDLRDGEKYRKDFISARDYGALMLRLAQTWRNSSDPAVKAEVGKYYLLMVRHLLDQGYVSGSNMGGRMIAGYSTREIFGSLLLMRDFLAENGLREELFRMGRWHFDLNMMLDDKYFLLPNADYFNINMRSALIAVLMLPDSPEKAARLRAFGKFASRNIGWETPGWMGGFKPDGTAFHHWGHYPAYVFGAMSGASAMVYYLAGTPYAVSPAAVATLKRAVNAADIYLNGNTAIALHGRNPYRSLPAAIVPACAKPLAKAGDLEMAALYKRTGGPRAAADKRFADVAPAPCPEGHWSFNYGGFGIHRLDGKMVTLKTHNHYIWAYEAYTGENRFGRYLSNGTVEITPAAGPEAAGHVAEGWDWNRLPGATALYRPWDMLNAPPEKRIDMPTIVGNRINGVSHLENRYGMMGTILAERDEPPRFDPTFKAVKSVFAFGPRIICLGSSIASDSPYPVETTLFQYETNSKKRPVFVNSPKPEPGEVKTTLNAPCFAADADDNVYFVLGEGNRLEVRRGRQESRDKSTMAPNSGEFAVGWIDHGVKPADAACEYLIMLGMKPAEAPGYLEKLKTGKPYRILRRDAEVHAVEDLPTGVTAAIFFTAQPSLDWELLKKISQPAYVMYRFREDGKLSLSLNTPDLAGFIREGYSDLPPLEQNPAAENADRKVTIVLAGKWRLAAPVPGVELAAEGKNTAITGSFRHGIAKQLLLERIF
ncbi:MAG: chondroitinase family polysaccharide lyase, partial [Victivallaceae bacterium]